MAQLGWVFLGSQGGRHRIGLYHGDRTGHVLILCNNRILQIDFNVKESRTYSFFIEDELCEVRIIKENGYFSYSCESNHEVDTPLNQARRIINLRDRKHTAIFFGSMILLLLLVLVGLKWKHHRDEALALSQIRMNPTINAIAEDRLKKDGQMAEAQFFIVREPNGNRSVFYGFDTKDKQRITGKFNVQQEGPILLSNGFSLSDRDIFTIVYLPSDPQTHYIEYNSPGTNTVNTYIEQAIEAENAAHPGQNVQKSACIVNLVLEKRGWPYLLYLIHQKQTPEENPTHNLKSYQRLLKGVDLYPFIHDRCQ